MLCCVVLYRSAAAVGSGVGWEEELEGLEPVLSVGSAVPSLYLQLTRNMLISVTEPKMTFLQ